MIDDPIRTALTPGQQLGPYQIESPLGAGGMGQVYKAHDTRLGRAVAIKILTLQFSGRFEREARAISSLNHPHICTLHDVGTNYLVMELLDGETLAARLKKGPLPQKLLLHYGAQIADALAAAHAGGIIHRDLKPANIMITKSGIKVLDFGLAKSHGDETLTATHAVLGTPAYMAPEQREGKECDERTDIYALGLLLYEMATLKRFAPDQPAPFSSLPDGFAHVVAGCLERDPSERWRSAFDIKKELTWEAQRPASALPKRSRATTWVWAAAAAVSLGILAVLAFLGLRRNAPINSPVKFAFDPAEDTVLMRQTAELAVSPDGQRIAYVARDAAGKVALWVRSLGAKDPQRIAGTDGASSPFWSPDGLFLGFFTDTKLRKIALAGGPPQNICSTTRGLGGSWSTSGDIVFNPTNRAPLLRVSASGGVPQSLTTLNSVRQENSHRWPVFLPDGRHFLFTARSSMKENTAIYAASLDSKSTKLILAAQSQANYIPGYLLFARDQSLMAQRFDAGRLELLGEAIPMVGGIDQETPSASGFFTASPDGKTLAYIEETHSMDQLTWFGRDGSKQVSLGPTGRYSQPNISPDGKRLAVVIPDPDNGNRDIWIIDLETGSRTRLTSNPANDWWPVWSRDSKYVTFASDRTPKSSVYRVASDGVVPEELLVPPPESGGAFSADWSRDGKLLAYSVDKVNGGQQIWTLPLLGDRKSKPFLATEYSETDLKFSPADQWIAYTSTESGSPEVYVRPFDNPVKQRVSANGGAFPRWRNDGKELFYVAPSGSLMVATIQPAESPKLKIAPPRPLFRTCPTATSPNFSEYTAMPDGSRFLFSCEEGTRGRPIVVTTGWKSLALR